MRILIFGAGVVGSVYGSRLQRAGHDVVLLARGSRLAQLRAYGLELLDARSGTRTAKPIAVVEDAASAGRVDLVLVPVRADQLEAALPALAGMTDGSDVLIFSNIGDHAEAVVAALGSRALFGFPGVGGTLDGSVVEHVLIKQQRTVLGEPGGITTLRVRRLQRVFRQAGFATSISDDIAAWLLAHAAFVVPIAAALDRTGTDPRRLATDQRTLRLMVDATREVFTALRAEGNRQIPSNIRLFYRMPTALVLAYWRRVLGGPNGELWFGAHTRAAPDEMRAVGQHLRQVLQRLDRPVPRFERLLAVSG